MSIAETRKVGASAKQAGARGIGRKKGVPNKNTAAVKDMILQALNGVGGAAYLQRQADENPVAFMTLVGKVLPLQVSGDPDNPLRTVTVIELIAPPVVPLALPLIELVEPAFP